MKDGFASLFGYRERHPEPAPPKNLRAVFQSSGAGQGVRSRLGLAIVKEIVEAHGGAISVESHEGKGSTFTLLCLGPKRIEGGHSLMMDLIYLLVSIFFFRAMHPICPSL